MICSVEGQSILYADDNTINVHAKTADQLQAKIQAEADNSIEWINANKLVCSGPKTKLLILGTSQLRRNVLQGNDIAVNVCQNVVKESKSEKLLGLIINNQLSWSDYLYGEQCHPNNNSTGLIQQLSKRVGLLSKFAAVVLKPS